MYGKEQKKFSEKFIFAERAQPFHYSLNIQRIAIFASGSGTNAENIIKHFQRHPSVKVELIASNNPDAFVLERAKKFNIPTLLLSKHDFYPSDKIIRQLKNQQIDCIVLAGFLWLIPENLIRAFPKRIINIHPALLPKYGGKGMYGSKVHEAVAAAREKETGITIHFVNEKYDEGEIIFQAKVPVETTDTPAIIQEKVHRLEYEHYPKVIEEILKKIEKKDIRLP